MLKNAKGFAILWVLAMVAILAAIAATAAPYLQEINDAERVAATIAIVRQVRVGVGTFGATVRQNNGGGSQVFPGDLNLLTNVVKAATASDHTTCGSAAANQYGTASVTDWPVNGPFVSFYIPVGGPWTPIGRIRDSVNVRANNAALFIEIPGVGMNDANLYEAMVDHGTGDTVTIVHAAVAGFPDTTTLRIRLISTGELTANFGNQC